MRNTTISHRLPRVGIVLLTLAAAAIHISRAVANPNITVLFMLNAVGYLALLALLYLPLGPLHNYQPTVRNILIGYAGLTFLLFFVWGFMKNEWPAIGFADKLIEAMLIGLLVYERTMDLRGSPRGGQQKAFR